MKHRSNSAVPYTAVDQYDYRSSAAESNTVCNEFVKLDFPDKLDTPRLSISCTSRFSLKMSVNPGSNLVAGGVRYLQTPAVLQYHQTPLVLLYTLLFNMTVAVQDEQIDI